MTENKPEFLSPLKVLDDGAWVCNGCCKEFNMKEYKPRKVSLKDGPPETWTPDIWYCISCYMKREE